MTPSRTLYQIILALSEAELVDFARSQAAAMAHSSAMEGVPAEEDYLASLLLSEYRDWRDEEDYRKMRNRPKCPKDRFAFKIENKRRAFSLMIGLKGDISYIPLAAAAFASRLPIIQFEFPSALEAESALRAARAWINANL